MAGVSWQDIGAGPLNAALGPSVMDSLVPKVKAWLHRTVAGVSPPPGTVAINFGLFETPAGFAAYLVGSDRYDPDDDSWACRPTFEPSAKFFELPSTEYNLSSWQDVQVAVVSAVREALADPIIGHSQFFQNRVVTVGFDDGDLERIA